VTQNSVGDKEVLVILRPGKKDAVLDDVLLRNNFRNGVPARSAIKILLNIRSNNVTTRSIYAYYMEEQF
jgi:hypothetical protein